MDTEKTPFEQVHPGAYEQRMAEEGPAVPPEPEPVAA